MVKKALLKLSYMMHSEIIRSKMGQDPMEVFDQALKNVMPVILKCVLAVSVVRTIKCQLKFVLIAVKPSVFVGFVNHARLRGERTMKERLAGELMDAFNNTGAAIKKKRRYS